LFVKELTENRIISLLFKLNVKITPGCINVRVTFLRNNYYLVIRLLCHWFRQLTYPSSIFSTVLIGFAHKSFMSPIYLSLSRSTARKPWMALFVVNAYTECRDRNYTP